MSRIPFREDLILGLDLGSNSIGWALLEQIHGCPVSVIDCGVRIFEAGVNIDQFGKNTSRNMDRRQARSRRRLLERRAMRLHHVMTILQREGLLPPGEPETPDSPLADLLKVDPYPLRARGLDHPLSLPEFGRAIYHIARRRGYESNRKISEEEVDDNEKAGVVREQTEKLSQEMQASGARTLGEYLSRLDPHQQRIRERYTLRLWYRRELNELWQAQQPHHPGVLTDKLKEELGSALFDQRPLKHPASMIGHCELEPSHKRAPMALPAAQRARLLQDVNHLRFCDPEGREHLLSPEQRNTLIEALEYQETMTFGAVRRLLKIPLRGWDFNLERAGRENLLGNKTACRMRGIFGERWDALSFADQTQVVEDWLTYVDDEALARRGQRAWGLDFQQATRFAATALEQGYSRHSREALKNLLVHLEAGLSYAEARKEAYGSRAERPALDELPPQENLRNPIVQRTLAELRKVVNHLLRKYGKPAIIRVELARDLKKSAKAREEIWKQNRDNERARRAAAERLLNERDIASPSRRDIEKVLLLEECGGVCPYTGQGISMADLFGKASRFDIDHIIPFSRSLDDSFMNKTLCLVEENRNVKRNRTPWETYGSLDGRWDEIIGRVKRFHGDARNAKLRRFQMRDVRPEGDAEFINEFSEQQLNDTRYASRLAREYLEKLYPADGKLHVPVSAGQVTAYLRSAWELNGLLKGGQVKSRDDHRHHAIDAVVIALSDAGWVHQLSLAASRSQRPGHFEDVHKPWPTFLNDVREAVARIIVSHRVSRRVNGPMHKETFYGLIKNGRHGSQILPVLRKRIEVLSASEIADGRIVDKAVREAVERRLRELGQSDPKKAFSDEANRPWLVANDGRHIPIKKVRVFQEVTTVPVGEGARQRNVKPGNNHHLEIFEAHDKRGRPVWRGEIVTVLEAMRRRKAGEAIVRRQDETGNPLVFSLSGREVVELDWKGERLRCMVECISNNDLEFVRNTDGRKAVDRKQERIRMTYSGLQKAQAAKRVITPIGEVHAAHD